MALSHEFPLLVTTSTVSQAAKPNSGSSEVQAWISVEADPLAVIPFVYF